MIHEPAQVGARSGQGVDVVKASTALIALLTHAADSRVRIVAIGALSASREAVLKESSALIKLL